MSKQPLTPLQRRTFFMGIRPAAQEVGMDPEEYRKLILKEELGVEHMADVSRGRDFDLLMQRVWADRGDYSRALEYATATLTRVRHLIIQAAEKIVSQKPEHKGSALEYVASVMRQCGMIKADGWRSWIDRLASESAWMDFTEVKLKKLLVMLNTHIRRRS